MKKKSNLTLLFVGLAAFVLLLVGAAWNQQTEGTSAPRALFDDGSPSGGKGFRLLLGRLDYTPRQIVAPQKQIPNDARVWLLLDPQARFSRREADDLTQWIKRGGTLIWCPNPPNEFEFAFNQREALGMEKLARNLGLRERGFSSGLKQRPPAQPELSPWNLDAPTIYRSGVQKASGGVGSLDSSRPHLLVVEGSTQVLEIPLEKGRALVFPDAWLFTNYGLAQGDNAELASNFVRANARGGAVIFDERSHDDNLRPPLPDSLWNRLRTPPYSWMLWQGLLAAVLLMIYTGRRMGKPVPLPDSGPVTRASQYAGAMGALFQKANKPRAAAKIIGEDFRRRLAKRVGLSPNESDQLLAQRASEICDVPFETLDALLLASRAPSENDARILRDAAEMERVLRILED